MGDSTLCASLKSGKRLIISIICKYYLLRSEKKTLFSSLRTHFVIALFFNFLEYIGSKENDYIHTLLLELLIFYNKVDFFVTNTRNVLKRSLDVD